MFNLPELFAGSEHFTAKREAWEEGHFIFGAPRRAIKNQDLHSTLIIDDRVRHFVKGDDVEFGAAIWEVKKDGEKSVIRHYIPKPDDIVAFDWVLENHTDLIKMKEGE